MTPSGLSCGPSGCCLQLPTCHLRLLNIRLAAFPGARKCKQENEFLQVERSNSWCSRLKLNTGQFYLVKSAMDASYSDMTNESAAIFPRINVRDPYKRLGIRREASEDELQAARNFLIQQLTSRKNEGGESIPICSGYKKQISNSIHKVHH